MELIKLKRATYRGVGLFANGKQLNRVTAFGATGTLSKEEVFELGNSKIIEIVEDSPDVSMTIDANEYGSVETLFALANKTTGNEIKFSEVFENTQVPIWNYVKETEGSETMFAQLMIGAVLTNYSANFSTDGNSTESFSLNADNKYWLRGDGVHIKKVSAELEGEELEEEEWMWNAPVGYPIRKLMSVELNGRVLSSSEYTIARETASVVGVNIPNTDSEDSVYFVVAGKGANDFDNFSEVKPNQDTFTNTIKRRGHIEVYLYNEEEEIKVTPAQSVSIDASLNREDIPALGFKRIYDRPLALPIDVTASIDVIFTDLDLFAKMVDAKDADDDDAEVALSLDRFRNDLGLRVKIFDRTDVDPESTGNERKPVKILEIPQIIPSDEAWNISLDGQATQTFSFRGMELIVKKGS
jgi:hypothetical protein